MKSPKRILLGTAILATALAGAGAAGPAFASTEPVAIEREFFAARVGDKHLAFTAAFEQIAKHEQETGETCVHQPAKDRSNYVHFLGGWEVAVTALCTAR